MMEEIEDGVTIVQELGAHHDAAVDADLDYLVEREIVVFRAEVCHGVLPLLMRVAFQGGKRRNA
jgi:hypothetical protein